MINKIEISDFIKGGVSPTQLLTPKGKLQMISSGSNRGNIFDNTGSFFIIQDDNFHFQFSAGENGLYVERNGEQCALPAIQFQNKFLKFFILTWSPTTLRLIGGGNDKKALIDITVETLPCSVPLSLKRWAKEKSLTPIRLYVLILRLLDQLKILVWQICVLN